MATTPLIKQIQNRYGIFYNFQSAIDDITTTLNQDNKKFRFSKFALLRIPDMGAPDDKENKVQFLALGETPMIDGINPTDYNINLAESFQNYCLNLEALLLTRTGHNSELSKTVAERVFWKWLKELGAMRFRKANVLEKDNVQLPSNDRFVEEDEYDEDASPVGGNYNYNKIVKYVSDIEVVHTVKKDNARSEVYIYVPTDVGTSPYVMFESYEDVNYGHDSTWFNNPESALDIEYLVNRHHDDTHPFGLGIKAFYDLDDGSVITNYSNDIDTPSWVSGNWFSGTSQNAYYTDLIFGDAGNQLIKKEIGSPATTIQYIRSKLDGIGIDFNLTNYKLANENTDIKVFSDFNSYIGTKNFEYNAILLFYDVFDVDNPESVVTNLYGVQFLNRVEEKGLEFAIPSIIKYKPDILSKTNGNSFAHKFNIKFDSSINNVDVEKSVNDYTTFSLDLFVDAMTSMINMTRSYEENIVFLTNLKIEVDGLKGLFINDTNKDEILDRIASIENSLTQSQSLFENTDTVMRMVNDLYDKYSAILNNTTSISVDYNMDQMVLNNMITHPQGYNFSADPRGSLIDNTVLVLNKYSNYFRHENASGVAITLLTDDLNVIIDDADVAWKRAQSFEIVFAEEFDPASYNVNFWTGALNKSGSGEYGTLIGTLDSSYFLDSGNKPWFKITCIDQSALEFVIDKIR